MASLIFALLKTPLKQAVAENTNLTHSYCSNNATTLLNTAKNLKI